MKTANKYLAAALLMATAAMFTGTRAAAQTSGPLFNEIAHQDFAPVCGFQRP
ncbi:hypothetical protein BH09BAC6_BH09BAC6_14770 [soil metagenome]